MAETEEEPKEEVKEEPKKPDKIEEAMDAAARMEEANKKMEENIQKLESLHAEDIVRGRADAGAREKHEETPQEYKDRIMKGSAEKND